MGRAAVLGVCALLLSSNVDGQEQKIPPAPRPIAESAERIGRELWPTEVASFTIDEEGRPRFHTGITEAVPAPPWALGDEGGALLPARGRISHREMLAIMTPPVFGPPLISGSADPGEMYHAMKKAWREWKERRIHERVTKELEEFERRAESDQAPD
jgi:hypothetical protein